MPAQKTQKPVPQGRRPKVVNPPEEPVNLEAASVNAPAENVNPPVSDEDRVLSTEEALALANAQEVTFAAAPAALDVAALEAEIAKEAAERARLEAEAAALAAPQGFEPEPQEPTHVRVMVLRSAQEGVFQATLNGRSYPLQLGIARRVPRDLIAVLEESDVTFEIVE